MVDGLQIVDWIPPGLIDCCPVAPQVAKLCRDDIIIGRIAPRGRFERG
jgi:hypothetical protein